MEFVIIAKDYKDENALERRLKARERHLELNKKLIEEGKVLFAAALLNENGTMIGSTLIVNFSDKDEIGKWLEQEPYVIGKVWENIEIISCKVSDAFK